MKYEQLWKDIETLCALRGPSGREAAVREYLIEQIKGHAEYEVDPLGNLLVRKKGKKPAKKVLQLSAHMDEVGFIITNIDEKGFLSFAPVGGIQPEVTGGRMVLVGDNAIPGMVGCKPVHLCDDKERSDPGKISNMKIDIGAKDKAEAEKLVSLGDMVTFTGPVVHYGEGRVAGRALDDRAGCAMLLAMIREELPCDCCCDDHESDDSWDIDEDVLNELELDDSDEDETKGCDAEAEDAEEEVEEASEDAKKSDDTTDTSDAE